jgi:hypothetical protein
MVDNNRNIEFDRQLHNMSWKEQVASSALDKLFLTGKEY